MNALLESFDPVSAAWGFAGSMVYATLQLRARLCGGEKDPDAAAKRRAWGEFCTVPIVGTPTAAAFSAAGAHFLPWLNGPGAAFAVGLLVNPVWPIVRDALTSKAFLKAISDGLIKVGQSMDTERRP